MKNFNSNAARFSLKALKKVKISERQKSKRNEVAQKTKETIKEIENIKKKKAQAEEKFLNELKNLRKQKKGTPSSQISADKYNKMKKQIERAFFEEKSSLKRQIKKMEATLKKLNLESTYTDLADHSETAKVFELILDDAYKAIDQIAEHYKIPFVFNSSFAFDRSFATGVVPSNPMEKFFDHFDEIENDDTEEAKMNLATELKFWLENKNRNLVNCGDARLSRFVLKGGINMTPAVIDYVYQKYNISKKQRDFIQKFHKDIIEQ
eukprot:Anaeramoba_ignava/a258_8.p2 GENE.a258_8~~a258_8.p2  ORF type:complete len:265 (-),score=33.64 a258_8:1191-1985(-)